jgi:hypothetical protein
MTGGRLPPFYPPKLLKSGSTIASDWFDGLSRWMTLAGRAGRDPILVHGGDRRQQRGPFKWHYGGSFVREMWLLGQHRAGRPFLDLPPPLAYC